MALIQGGTEITSQDLTDIGNLSGTNSGNQTLPTRDSLSIDTNDNITFAGITVTGNIVPSGTTRDLGTPAAPWRALYTGDLRLRNNRGDYFIEEEEEYLSVRNNKTGKWYKLVMEEIDKQDPEKEEGVPYPHPVLWDIISEVPEGDE